MKYRFPDPMGSMIGPGNNQYMQNVRCGASVEG